MHDSPCPFPYGRTCSCTVAIAVVLAVALCLLAGPATAHPPANMNISYDPSASKISVTLTHPVDDPATHYLRTVRVKLNGEVISDPDYKSQPEKDTFTYTYDVRANPGDAVWVTAICNRAGSIEQSYTVPQPVRIVTTAQVPSTYTTPPTAAPETLPTTQSSPGLLPLLGAAAAVLVIKRG